MKSKSILSTIKTLRKCRPSSETVVDGSIIHVKYKSGGKHTDKAIAEAETAKKIGVPMDEYHGRFVKMFFTKNGDVCFTMSVLERHNLFRTFNVDKGNIKWIKILEK